MGMLDEIDRINRAALVNDEWLDLVKWTGRPETHLPKTIRPPDDVLIHCDNLTLTVSDAACDPRQGGIAGVKHLALFYGVTEKHFRRNILPHLEWIRWLGDIPVTNVASIWAHSTNYKATVYKTRCRNLQIDFNVSSGYIHQPTTVSKNTVS